MTNKATRPVLYAASCISVKKAQLLADQMGIKLTTSAANHKLLFQLSEHGLEFLFFPEKSKIPLRVMVDFTQESTRSRICALHKELLVQAIKIKKRLPQRIIDATGGLGRDGFLLAAAGCQVHIFERNPYIGALLRDGLERAATDKELSDICRRITLHQADAVSQMKNLKLFPAVIYLDRMFTKRKKSAKVKQNLQALQQLEGKSGDNKQLLLSAWQASPKKIVVKRPAKSKPLCNLPPSYSLEGKAVRFDVYLPLSMPDLNVR